jgi:very-short-patch-repair endonuclease
MRALLAAEGEPAITRSEAERLMRRLIRQAQLPQPKSNVKVAGYEVDFLWPKQRVIVEVDGYRFHSHRSAFERDHRKDLALQEAGYLVIRITWRQLEDEPLAVIAHVARALDRRARGHG